MKHLPNLLTLANLFCGCLAIVYLLTAQPFVYRNLSNGSLQWIMGTEQLYLGTMFIGIAAVCDMLDGFVARALGVFSPIGKDLDSLADVVSFGVAPSVILFKCLWDAVMQERNALDANMLAMAPAFLLACFAALRLAKFNITTASQANYFVGMPTPAVGLFVGALPFVLWNYPSAIVANVLHSKWAIYGLIALLCWLMVSNVRFFKLIPRRWRLADAWPQLVLVIVSAAALVMFGMLAVPIAFALYILLSLLYRYPTDGGEVVSNS
jgi:CDP-diacylglycerol---serine O-phosphatidyltransferase